MGAPEVRGIGSGNRLFSFRRQYDGVIPFFDKHPIRFVRRILSHKSISSTEHYYESIGEEEAWQAFQSALKPVAA
jgi:hypothetical protein